jgi:hypothetical protein
LNSRLRDKPSFWNNVCTKCCAPFVLWNPKFRHRHRTTETCSTLCGHHSRFISARSVCLGPLLLSGGKPILVCEVLY